MQNSAKSELTFSKGLKGVVSFGYICCSLHWIDCL